MTEPGDGEASTDPVSSPPARIGRYRVSRLVGSGAFATVYLAWDDALDVPVAIKVLAQNWSFEPEVRRRFIQEAQLLRRVDGTRVVRVHDIGETDEGQPFFVMDYASRGTIEDRLLELAEDGEELDAHDVIRFCRQLAAGVEEVHRLQVAHRDLKPSNLLLRTVDDTDGASAVGTRLVRADERVVVSDLGLAKDLLGPTRLTVAAGTPGYMAPEQLDPSARIDERADIYSCTAVLHRVVSGGHPSVDGPAFDPTVLDELPAAAAALLLQGLAEDPDDRFDSPEQWLLAVEEAVAELGAIGPGEQAGELVSGLSRLSGADQLSRPRSAASAGSEVQSVTWRPSRIAEGPNTRRWLPALLAVLAVAVGGIVFWATRGGDSGGDQVATDDSTLTTDASDATDATGDTADPDPGSDDDAGIDDSANSTAPSTSTPPGDSGDGSGPPAPVGEREPADSTVLFDPVAIALAPDGSLAIAEMTANRIRRFEGTDLVTVAGTGVFGFSGDTGLALNAELAEPQGLDYGPTGELFVVDGANSVVRRVDTSGRIQVIAGSGQPGYAGDGGLATSARLSPTDVAAMADGSVLIADLDNSVIRRVDTNGIISTVLGPADEIPGGRLSAPVAVEAAADGSFVVADLLTHRVMRVSSVDEPDVTVVAGTGTPGDSGDGGPATAAQLAFPSDVALDAEGRIFVADRLNHRVKRIDADGTIVTIAGNGSRGLSGDGADAVAAQLSHPMSLTVDRDGVVYIADAFNNRVRTVSDGVIETVAGAGATGEVGDGGPAADAPLGDPFGIAVGGDELFLVENWSGRLRRVDGDGVIETVIGSLLLETTDFIDPLVTPTGLSLASGGTLAITEAGSHRITLVDLGDNPTRQVLAGVGSSGFSGDGGPASAASLSTPTGLTWTSSGDLLIADSGNHRLRRITFTETGPVILTVAGTGDLIATPDGLTPEETTLLFPYAVVEGPDGAIYVSEAAGSRVRRILDGAVSTVIGTGVAGSDGDGGPGEAARVDTPSGLAVGPDGSLYVADLRANVVRRVAPDGVVSTIAGDGAPGFGGDGGPATSARLNAPSFLAVDGDLLHIVDTGNRRVRTVDLSTGTITTTAGGF